ncbi:MAG: hypothetical protein IJI14_16770 [Anaerolineaceae bacterium]|nr:hypothetical protein [Anaerolineaceae bacterium]
MNEKIRLTAGAAHRAPELEPLNVKRFCPKCGREIPLDRKACAYCENTGAVHEIPRSRGKKLLSVLRIALILFILLILALFLTRNTGL